LNDSLCYFAAFFFLLDLGLVAVRASVLQVRLDILAPLSEKKPKVVGRTLKLLEKQHLRAGLRAGLILTHLILGVLCWMWVDAYFGLKQNPWWVIVVMLVVMTVVLGVEFALEWHILKKREIWALRLTPLGEFFNIILRPYSWAMDILKASPDKTSSGLLGVTTDEELKTWVGSGQSDGALEMGERKMIYSILEFGDTLCREIMVPRIDVYTLEAETTLAAAIEGIKECGHSRVPVYDDVVDNIIGLLYAKDLLQPMLEGKSEASIRGFLRPVYFVPEAKRVDELLREMQSRSIHMAVVVDEYGGVAGI